MTENGNGHGSRTGAFLVGATLGAAVALLMAPRSGRELRGQLKDTALQMKDKALQMKGRVKETVAAAPEKIRETGSKLYDEAKQTVGTTFTES